MLVITTTNLTESARAKAKESTGEDPGPAVYRLHRDSCPRVKPADDPQPADAAPAAAVLAAKTCTRCSPPKAEVAALVEEAEKAPPAPEPEKPKTRKPGGPRKAAQAAPKPSEPVEVTLDVHAGPAAVLDAQGRVLPIRPAAYPEVVNHPLICAGCGETKSASAFQFVTKKGDGRGRFVECTPCQTARLAANKERKAKGEAPVPSPRFEVKA